MERERRRKRDLKSEERAEPGERKGARERKERSGGGVMGGKTGVQKKKKVERESVTGDQDEGERVRDR